MSPRNHADYTNALSGHFRSLLAQFGLTPKSRRGMAASDPGEAVDVLEHDLSRHAVQSRRTGVRIGLRI